MFYNNRVWKTLNINRCKYNMPGTELCVVGHNKYCMFHCQEAHNLEEEGKQKRSLINTRHYVIKD